MERDEEVLIELEGSGQLHHDLPHTLQELREDWTGLLLFHHRMPTSR